MKLVEGEREAVLNIVGEILKNSDKSRENLVPILQQVQRRHGYLPALALEEIAAAMGIPAVDLFGLATFYNQFRLTPPGKHQVKVCMGTACYMVGGKIALDSFERRMEIKEGETSPDRQFSLERVACVGCCTMAPVVVVDERVEGYVTPTRVDGIMLELANNAGEGSGRAHEENQPDADREGEKDQ